MACCKSLQHLDMVVWTSRFQIGESPVLVLHQRAEQPQADLVCISLDTAFELVLRQEFVGVEIVSLWQRQETFIILQVASSDGTNTLMINALSCIHSRRFSQPPALL
jgi:hypothetical protein